MLDNIVSLSKQLISIQSDPDNRPALQEALDLVVAQFDSTFTVEHFEHNCSKSILVYCGEQRPEKFKIILNGHLDVIPGKQHQYKPHIDGDRLYGVGSMDMKSNVVCLITAFKSVAHCVNYPLALQIVTDEEIGGFDGTKHQIDMGVKADFVIAGETTNFDIVHKAKGVLRLKASFVGQTAHGAYPRKGENAIWKAHQFLSLLQEHYLPLTGEARSTSVNLSRIETANNSFNKIPDDCTVSLDIRYIPGELEGLLDTIQALVNQTGGKLDIVTKEPALFVGEDNYYVQQIKSATEAVLDRKIVLYGANGSSDARHYTHIDTHGIEFGPIGGGIGTDEERIDIPSLGLYCTVLEKFLLAL